MKKGANFQRSTTTSSVNFTTQPRCRIQRARVNWKILRVARENLKMKQVNASMMNLMDMILLILMVIRHCLILASKKQIENYIRGEIDIRE